MVQIQVRKFWHSAQRILHPIRKRRKKNRFHQDVLQNCLLGTEAKLHLKYDQIIEERNVIVKENE